MCSSSASGITVTDIHSDIIKSNILNRLDAATLASAGCAGNHFLCLCSDDLLWKNICNSKWPSTTHPLVRDVVSTFPSGHKSFYYDSYPIPTHLKSHETHKPMDTTTELISAVDVYCDDNLIYSKVISIDTLSSLFKTSPFQVDLLGPQETVATPLNLNSGENMCISRAKESLRVSWILIDCAKKRAINVASHKVVHEWYWFEREIKLYYATVVANDQREPVLCVVVMTCGWKEGGDQLHVKELTMHMEDIGERVLNGMKSLVTLNGVMQGPRQKRNNKLEKDTYAAFLNIRAEKERRQEKVEFVCGAFAASIVYAILTYYVFFR